MVAWPFWPLFGRTRTLNAAAYCASMSTVSAGQHWNGQVAGTRDTVYGSEGWGFESLRARHGLSTELPVSYRQNCIGDRFFIVPAGSDIGSGWGAGLFTGRGERFCSVLAVLGVAGAGLVAVVAVVGAGVSAVW